MMSSHTTSFTRTHAREIASKVAADLRQMNRLYDKPNEAKIQNLIKEFVEFVVNGYMRSIEYGFKRDGDWVLSARYEIRADGTVADTGPGGLYAHADVDGLPFYSYLDYSDKWWELAEQQRQGFCEGIPVKRSGADAPGHAGGYWEGGRSYASGGVGAERKVWRPT